MQRERENEYPIRDIHAFFQSRKPPLAKRKREKPDAPFQQDVTSFGAKCHCRASEWQERAGIRSTGDEGRSNSAHQSAAQVSFKGALRKGSEQFYCCEESTWGGGVDQPPPPHTHTIHYLSKKLVNRRESMFISPDLQNGIS